MVTSKKKLLRLKFLSRYSIMARTQRKNRKSNKTPKSKVTNKRKAKALNPGSAVVLVAPNQPKDILLPKRTKIKIAPVKTHLTRDKKKRVSASASNKKKKPLRNAPTTKTTPMDNYSLNASVDMDIHDDSSMTIGELARRLESRKNRSHKTVVESIESDVATVASDEENDNNDDDDEVDEDEVDMDDDGGDVSEEKLDSQQSDSSDLDEEIGDEESDVDGAGTATTITTKQPKKRFVLEATFESKRALDEFLRRENCWSYRGCSISVDGERILYRCNRIKRNERVQCAASIYTIEKVSYEVVAVEENNGAAGGSSNPDGNGVECVGQNVVPKKSFVLFRKETDHTHDELPNVLPAKIKYEIEQQIIAQFKDGRKAKAIFYNLLGNDNIPMVDKPSHKQVANIIDKFKRNNYGAEPLTMRQLTKFVEKQAVLPDANQPDKAFIVRFERTPPNVQGAENKFYRFFISTRRLLSVAGLGTIVHGDATHKVTNEKLPLIVAGVTDENSKFHFTGLTICNHEDKGSYHLTFRAMRSGVRSVNGVQFLPKVLVCDADGAIHNAFKLAFYPARSNDGVDGATTTTSPSTATATQSSEQLYTIIMCYFHVTLNVQTKYKFQIRTNKTLFLDDIYVLHICSSVEQFDHGCKLFVKKWAAIEPEATRLVEKSFFKEHKHWFIGSHPRTPKHNNGLEAFNSSLKRCQTEHRRQPLKQFISTAISIVNQRSLEYLKGRAAFQTEVQIDKELLARGCALKLQYAHGPELPNGNTEFYAYRSDSHLANSSNNAITLNGIRTYQQAKYKTFGEFKSNGFELYTITFPGDPNKWKEATCTCPYYDGNFMCKHVISIAHTLGLIPNLAAVTANADYDDEPLFVQKRGRPKEASAALLIDT